ncbi:uncharacterized protein LOC125833110 [Solanum verrucosum]|uniref:uncharacterized protein LOC125833110 n=1 Tax=Solanum verrucosum TaxID=315347 RepID=UPI0020D021D3|nr:uncharacterized protein LOC125833110 [Solanum verrucosum]
MDNQSKIHGDEDAMLMDVPISVITPQKSKVDDLENMDTLFKVDVEDAIVAISISSVAPQDDVLEYKVGDEDATLREVPISFFAPQESKDDVVEKMDKHHKVDRRDAIMAIPISSVAPQAGVSLNMNKLDRMDGDEDATLTEVPISFIALEKAKVDVLQNMDKQDRNDGDEDATLTEVPISFIALEKANVDVLQNEMLPKNMHYMHTHTFEHRKRNWIIKNISRPGGLIIDYVYHHLETNKKFRSLIEVYKFLVYGEVPEITKKLRENEEPLQVTPRRKPHVRGKKLIKKYVVGTCIESCNGIYIKNRGEANYLSERDIPSNIEKKRKRENEDLYGHQQVNLGDDATHVNSGDAALSTFVHTFLYLWDFELIPEAHNENLS